MGGINWDAKQVHKDMVLAMLMHHMSQEHRRMLMLECPTAYNDVVGREIVTIHRVSNGEQITTDSEIPTTVMKFG